MTERGYAPYTVGLSAKGVNVVFAHDTEFALNAAAALVNTEQADDDALADVSALDRFVSFWGWTGSRRGDAAELERVRALRPRLRALWHADEDGVVAAVNSMLTEGRALPQLVTHGEWGYHLHATSPDAPLADRMMVEAAMAIVDIVRTGELDRLRVCGAPGCADVVVDLSKNRSRRYCSVSCSNRVNMAAFRARRAGT
jgi:predicted RNA-binding Zn ribbon-like protein